VRIRAALAGLVVSAVAAGSMALLGQSANAAVTPAAINISACVQASLRVDDAGKAANTAADALAAVVKVNATLQTNVDVALAALAAATAAVQSASAANLPAALAAAATAQAKLTAALAALANSVDTSALKTALVTAQAALQVAIGNATAACLDTPSTTVTPTPTVIPTTTPPTTTPAPTTIPVPEVMYPNCTAVRDAGKAPLASTDPGYRAELDADGDGYACELVEGNGGVITVPVGGVDTGWAPLSA
jgi:hypothetical protein